MLSLFLSFQREKHPYYNLTVKVLRARNIKGTDVCKYLLKVLWKQVGSLVHTSSTESVAKGASSLCTLHCLYVSTKASHVKHYIYNIKCIIFYYISFKGLCEANLQIKQLQNKIK